MLLTSILNKVEKYKSFVYESAHWGEQLTGDPPKATATLEVKIRERANSRPLCSGCGQARPGYDRLPLRRYQYVPLLGLLVFFLYAPRRVNCPGCGVKVEKVPWAEGKSQLTTRYQWFLAGWAKLLSWKQVARCFRTSWDSVFRSVKMAVSWGLAHRDLSGIESLGVDEVQWQKGHKYLLLVYQIDKACKRLLWIGQDRKAKTLLAFFRWFGPERSAQIKFICSDMWKPFLQVIRKKAAGALHILDRFHLMALVNKAIDKIRAGEARQMKADGHAPLLKHSRWCWLKRVWNLTASQAVKLGSLLRYNLATVRAYLLKERLQEFWEYRRPSWAGRYMDSWCTAVLRSRLEPMKKVARTFREHRELILNWFRAKGKMSSGVVEGLNYNVKLTMRKAYGFRTYESTEVALYHRLGKLPEPETTHKFCG